MTPPDLPDFDPARPEYWPEPPEPTAEVWEKARTRIQARLPRQTPRRPRWAAAGLVIAGVFVIAGAVGWAVFPRPPEAVGQAFVITPSDPLADFDVLPIASEYDVMVSAVRGGEVAFGSIDHPVPEALPLATGVDVAVRRGPTAGELHATEPSGMAVYVMPPADK